MASLIFQGCPEHLFSSSDDALSISTSALSKIFSEMRVMTNLLENTTIPRRSARLSAPSVEESAGPDQSENVPSSTAVDPLGGVRQALRLLTDVVESMAAAQVTLLSTLGYGEPIENSTTAIVSPWPIAQQVVETYDKALSLDADIHQLQLGEQKLTSHVNHLDHASTLRLDHIDASVNSLSDSFNKTFSALSATPRPSSQATGFMRPEGLKLSDIKKYDGSHNYLVADLQASLNGYALSNALTSIDDIQIVSIQKILTGPALQLYQRKLRAATRSAQDLKVSELLAAFTEQFSLQHVTNARALFDAAEWKRGQPLDLWIDSLDIILNLWLGMARMQVLGV